jgi:pentapeptide MXKDX repeat protein
MGVDREIGRLLQTTTYQPLKGNIMSKLLTAVLAAVFAVVTVSPVAFAQEMKKDEKKAKTEPKKEKAKTDAKKTDAKKTDTKKKAEEKK